MPTTPPPILPASPFDAEQRAAVKLGPTEIEWRTGATFQQNGKWYGALLGYINARTCMDKLDALWPQWESHYTDHLTISDKGVTGYVVCRLTLDGVPREDVGVPSSMEGAKGAYSDALKRTAVQFGIGRELYDLPTIIVLHETKNDKAGRPTAMPIFADGEWKLPPSADGYVRKGTAVARAGAAAPPADPNAPMCPVHHKAFRHGNKGWYCATKVSDGPDGKPVWCDQHPGETSEPTPAPPANEPAPSSEPTYAETPTYEGQAMDLDDIPF